MLLILLAVDALPAVDEPPLCVVSADVAGRVLRSWFDTGGVNAVPGSDAGLYKADEAL